MACGAGIADSARFCRACGADQQAGAVPVVPADEAPTAQLRSTAAPRPPAVEPTAVAPPAARGGGGRAGFVAGLIAIVLAFGAIGGGATYLLLLAPDDDETSSTAPASLPIGDAPASADAAPSSAESEDDGYDGSSADDYGIPSSDGGEPGVLPDVSTSEMEEDITAMMAEFHEAVVDRRFTDAWVHLSRRAQERAERDHGFSGWREGRATQTPYLEPWGIEVSIEAIDRSRPVVQVLVTGMDWTKPDAPCSEWSGLTWVRYEDGVWRYDPGYSATPQRERRWKPRYDELLGASC